MKALSDLQKRLLQAAAGICGAVSGWALLENTVLLCVSKYEAGYPGLPRIVQISDLHRRHFGKAQKRLIRRTAKLQPDIIVITGDLVSREERSFTETEHLLRRLRKLAPVLAVPGNHEGDLPPESYEQFRKAVRRGGAVLLENEIVTVKGIPFAGVFLPRSCFRGGSLFGLRPAEACSAELMQELLGSCPPHTVLLAHNPLYFPAYAQWGAALTLSGHVHGGFLRLPGIGGVISPERRLFPRYDKGHYRQNGSEMVVSAGLGNLRLFNPPELCLITSGTGKN